METFTEQTLEVQAEAVASEYPQAGPDKGFKKSTDRSPAKSANPPPRRRKNEALVLKHYRLRAIDIKQTEVIAHQRGTDLGDLVRKQYERGVNVDTALGAPASDGLYGLYQGSRLAELLRADIDGLISFALNHGVVPTILQEYRRIIGNLNEVIQSNHSSRVTSSPVPQDISTLSHQTHQQPQDSAFPPATEVEDEANGVIGMFFGGSESSDETG
jgi:hypothetical protein